jgi:transcriptional regulator with XRE-family HTH domain
MAKIFRLTKEERATLATNVKRFRGTTPQRLVAERIGMAGKSRFISEIENQKLEPSFIQLVAIAEAIGVNVYELLPNPVCKKLPADIDFQPKTKPFDAVEARTQEQDNPGDASKFDIIIPIGLLDAVAERNKASIRMSHIVCAALNHFMNLPMFEGIRFVFKNVKDKDYEVEFVHDLLTNDRLKECIEVIHAIIERKE